MPEHTKHLRRCFYVLVLAAQSLAAVFLLSLFKVFWTCFYAFKVSFGVPFEVFLLLRLLS